MNVMLFMFYFLVHETHTSLIFQINAGLLMVYVFYSMVAVEKSGIMSVLLKKTGNMLLHGILWNASIFSIVLALDTMMYIILP